MAYYVVTVTSNGIPNNWNVGKFYTLYRIYWSVHLSTQQST